VLPARGEEKQGGEEGGGQVRMGGKFRKRAWKMGGKSMRRKARSPGFCLSLCLLAPKKGLHGY